MSAPNTSLTDFGTCWSTGEGNDLTMPAIMASGFQVIAEAIIRRWSTPAGGLIDDPTYGRNLMGLIGKALSPRDVAREQQGAGAEAEKDERVLSCAVTLTLDNVTGLLTVAARAVTALGPFSLVASVSAVGVQLLQVSP